MIEDDRTVHARDGSSIGVLSVAVGHEVDRVHLAYHRERFDLVD